MNTRCTNEMRLGYGCSMLMSRLDRRSSLKLLECALDAGIMYFDTARLYGYGEAESVLGDLLSGRRDKLFVATKAGILPPRRSRIISTAKGIIRLIVRISPSLKPYFRRKAEARIQASQFDTTTIATSLETSLRELRTDYIDLFLLHECEVQDLSDPSLLELLRRFQREGKIRSFGVAAGIRPVESIIETKPEYAAVVQFPSSVWNRNIERIDPRRNLPMVIHSILGRKFRSLYRWLQQDPDRLRSWSGRLDVDCRDMTALGSVFITYALNSNPSGVTLFSSISESKIRSNAVAFRETVKQGRRAEALQGLIEDLPHLEDPA